MLPYTMSLSITTKLPDYYWQAAIIYLDIIYYHKPVKDLCHSQ
jgi:hypothetical protein